MRKPKPWREWTTVERADVYSGLSLVGLMWLLPPAVIMQFDTMSGVDTPNTVIAIVFMSATLCAGTWGLVRPSFLLPGKPVTKWQVLFGYVNPVIVMVLVLVDNRTPSMVSAYGTLAFVTAWVLGTVPGRTAIVTVLGIGLVAPVVLTGRPTTALLGLVIACFCLFATRSSVWLRQTVRDLDAARTAQAELAVAEERLRFSRDVHDVLGRRLSAIALQAELASRLVARGDETGPARLMDVQATASEALHEARELARGYRPVDLAQEVDGARSLLAAAGIEVDVRLEGLPDGLHEPAAWVVRETLTNVLRHSEATQVVVTWREPELVVTNDRPSPDPATIAGTGLESLRERLVAIDGDLTTTSEGTLFTVRARLTGDRPAILSPI